MLAADLAADARWPGFVAETRAHGVQAVFAFPMRQAAVGVGVLTAYASRAGALDEAAASACSTYAEVAALVVVERHGQEDPTAFLYEGVQIRTTVHQAQGIAMVDLAVGLPEALARMRAAAFADGVPLDDLAADIVAGRRRLEPGAGPPGPTGGSRSPPP